MSEKVLKAKKASKYKKEKCKNSFWMDRDQNSLNSILIIIICTCRNKSVVNMSASVVGCLFTSQDGTCVCVQHGYTVEYKNKEQTIDQIESPGTEPENKNLWKNFWKKSEFGLFQSCYFVLFNKLKIE